MKTVYTLITVAGKWLREYPRKTTYQQTGGRVNTLIINTVNSETQLSSIPPVIMNSIKYF